MADAKAERIKRHGFGIEGLVSIFMTAAALGPMLLLIAAGAPLFAHAHNADITFEYWTLLIVLFVLGTAFLISRVFSAVLARQINPLVDAAAGLAPGTAPAATEAPGEVGSLSHKFDQIETVLFEGRRQALMRIRELEHENTSLREAALIQTRFMSEAAHEIRTPLSAIVSAARIIQRYHEKTPDVVDRFGTTIITEGNRLVRLISDMVDLAKIQSGALKWEDEELRAATVLGDATKAIDEVIKQHELQLHVDVSERLPSLWIDRKRLVQVLENLIRNAAKFTPAHGRIDIVAREEDGAVHFTVKDTGQGIAEELIPRLFEKTSMLPTGKGRGEQAGAGLGLALCRQIVTHYGGRIWARNGARCGAEFHFAIPALAVGLGPDLFGVPERRPLRVLLLMKNSVLADCAVRALRLDEIESRVCARLQDVFMVITTWTPDVIVVSPSFAWQLTDTVQERIRKLGVSHILMFSQAEGFVEVSPPTHMEPLLAAVARLSPGGSRVLLVDDDPEYGSVIEFELTQTGYAVERAYNGVDAVTAAARGPAVLVLDLALPQLDGFGVLEELKVRGVSVPTIVLTALDDPAVEARLRDLGAVEVFRKFELILATVAQETARVREILTPVLAANPSEVSREAGLLANGTS